MLASDHRPLTAPRQLPAASAVPMIRGGVCSSRAFLIHKWMAIHAFTKRSDPVSRLPGIAVVCLQEIKRRMRTRFTWILGIAALISVAVLVACSSKYSASNNALVVVSTQGNAVMDSFSLDLGNGHTTQIFNSGGPPTNGVPTSVVLDPAGAFAYVLVTQSSTVNQSSTGVQSFTVASDGKLGSGTTTVLSQTSTVVTVCNGPGQFPVQVTVQAPVVPDAMVIDSGGKFLFVADAVTSGQTPTYQCNGTMVTSTVRSEERRVGKECRS